MEIAQQARAEIARQAQGVAPTIAELIAHIAAQVWFCELCQESQHPLAPVHKLIIDEQTTEDIDVCGNCCDCEVWGPPCNPRAQSAETFDAKVLQRMHTKVAAEGETGASELTNSMDLAETNPVKRRKVDSQATCEVAIP